MMFHEDNHTCLCIFDVFRGQETPIIHEKSQNNGIHNVNVPANCTDKLQPLDISVNKPLKDEMKKLFHTWYVEVHNQIVSSVQDVRLILVLQS